MNTGKILYMIRARENVTQVELSKRTGITATSISNWETGRFEPSVYNFVTLLNAMGYDLKVCKLDRKDAKNRELDKAYPPKKNEKQSRKKRKPQ